MAGSQSKLWCDGHQFGFDRQTLERIESAGARVCDCGKESDEQLLELRMSRVARQGVLRALRCRAFDRRTVVVMAGRLACRLRCWFGHNSATRHQTVGCRDDQKGGYA
jgi:hypothetical protein